MDVVGVVGVRVVVGVVWWVVGLVDVPVGMCLVGVVVMVGVVGGVVLVGVVGVVWCLGTGS